LNGWDNERFKIEYLKEEAERDGKKTKFS